jgi:hypothetical protein
MFELKRLSREAVPAALRRAAHYRLLNDPWAAESICRDVLEVEPASQDALVTLLLALTDQFGTESGVDVAAARSLLPRVTSEYQRHYYEGLISERWAKRLLARSVPGSGPMIYDWLRQAMDCYQKAEPLRPPGDDDAVLRWNTCARLIARHEHLRPAPEGERAAIQLE